jgi:hypothetical protein
MRIAYLILAHKNIGQLCKLLDILISHIDNHVFIHLDRKYNPQIEDSYLTHDRITFLDNRISVSWGGFSVVEATQLLLKEAFNSFNFDYYILLSGQCLTIKSQNEIRGHLNNKNGCSIIHLIDHIDDDNYLYKFYYPVFFDELSFIKFDRFKIGRKKPYVKKMIVCWVRKIYKLIKIKRKIPKDIEPHFGSQWWILHKDHVKYVLDFIRKRPDVLKYFKHTWAPDELFFQSILMSSPLKEMIINKSLWYIDWNTNGPPKTLTMDDFDEIVNSDKFFARKFDSLVDSEIIERISEKVLTEMGKKERWID